MKTVFGSFIVLVLVFLAILVTRLPIMFGLRLEYGTLIVLLAVFLAFGLYLLPGIIASARNHRQSVPIWLLNVLLGWTVLGWVGALIWAAMAGAEQPPSHETH